MGTIKDEHLILSCGEREPLDDIRLEIITAIHDGFADEDYTPNYADYVSPVLSALANGGYYLFIPADGSKEGWGTSNVMDDVRELIRARIIYHNAKGKDKISVICVIEGDYEKLRAEDWI